MDTPRQESQWVLRAQCGDGDALEHLLRSVQPVLRRYLWSLVGPSHADDLLQDTLILVARKLTWLDEPEVFRSWAFRIASREGFRHLRKARRWMGDDEALDQLPAPDERPSGQLLEELLAMDGIPPASRAVLALHFREEMSLLEVAAILEIPLGTVKSRLAYGLASIRKQLAKKQRSE